MHLAGFSGHFSGTITLWCTSPKQRELVPAYNVKIIWKIKNSVLNLNPLGSYVEGRNGLQLQEKNVA